MSVNMIAVISERQTGEGVFCCSLLGGRLAPKGQEGQEGQPAATQPVIVDNVSRLYSRGHLQELTV